LQVLFGGQNRKNQKSILQVLKIKRQATLVWQKTGGRNLLNFCFTILLQFQLKEQNLAGKRSINI